MSSVALVETRIKDNPQKETSVFDGMDTTLRALGDMAPALNLGVVLSEIDKDISRAIDEFDARDPSRVLEPHIVPALRNLRAVIRNVSDSPLDEDLKYDLLFRLRNKEDEFMRAGNLLAAISLEVTADPHGPVTPGRKFRIASVLTNRSHAKVENVELGLSVRGGIQFSSKPGQCDLLGYNERFEQQFDASAGEDAEFTRPYFSRQDPYRENAYHIDQPQYADLASAPPQILGTATYRIAGVRFSYTQPARDADGRLVSIAPAISVTLATDRGVLPVSRHTSTAEVRAEILNNAASPGDVKVHLELPAGWTASPAGAALHFTHAGEAQTVEFRVTAAAVGAHAYPIAAVAEFAGKTYRDGYETIAHPDLEARQLYHPATGSIEGVEVHVSPNLKVAYVMGSGDLVPQALAQIGIRPQMLSPQDLGQANLAAFDAILVGIRASATRPDYRAHNARLLDYVKNGGTLIVEYQTPEFDQTPFGPYPFQMGPHAEEVTEEDAKIAILDPANPVFNVPNKITEADFDGWVEERGSKFMTEWDPQYKPLIECHDRDQAPQRGGLLQAHYGKGTFTYLGLALYRQLPAGVPGAYRLLANLISAGRAK